jgi:nitroreductase
MSFSEPFEVAWQAKYGEDPPEEASEAAPGLTGFLRHRSIRRYSDRPVSEELVAGLVAAAQSAATSSNLQLWSVLSVQEPERREAIAHLCADQEQVRQAPWFLTFLADHRRLREAAERAGQVPDGLDYVEFFTMAVIDAALAAERMVCAAEAAGLGICYIGALRNDPEGVKRLLELPQGVFGVFGLCLGWPEEPVRSAIKPRLRQDAVWFRERYPQTVSTGEYDERMRSFYEQQGMKGEITWSMRSGRRADGRHMTGRDVLRGWLEKEGFNLR